MAWFGHAPSQHQFAVFIAMLVVTMYPGHIQRSAAQELGQDSSGGGAKAQGNDARAQQPAALEQTPLDKVLSSYMSNEDLGAHLLEFADRCGDVARLHSVGETPGGSHLFVLTLGKHLDEDSEPRPAFRYIGNMHGDEPTGRPLLLGLAEWLCARQNVDAQAAAVLEGMQLHLMPSMNPDGFAAHTRGNSNNKDLNRDFPDPLKGGARSRGPLPATGNEQPETAAVMEWATSQTFVASAGLHEGALVANYPWDANDPEETGYAKSPDDATFRHLAETYANAHASMSQTAGEFAETHGITNGAAWYPVFGGLQDWSYIDRHTMELTLEVSPRKWPDAGELADLFAANLPALLALPTTALLGGLRGFVRGAVTVKGDGATAALEADIRVEGIDSFVLSGAKFGDYYRPLAPGSYRVEVSAVGFGNATADVVVPDDGSGVQQDFLLELIGEEDSAAGEVIPVVVPAAAAGSASASASSNAATDWSLELPPGMPGGGRLRGGQALLWAALVLAALALAAWAVRRRRRRRWARD